MPNFIVTIDGPCGAGKTATAKALAKQLNAMYLDTGALYRSLGYAFTQKNQNFDDMFPCERIDQAKQILQSEIRITHNNGQMRIHWNNEEITDKIRSQAASDAASKISVYQEIRDLINETARKLAASQNIIAEGRDTGTYLFPNADCKFYLTAQIKHRTQRRMLHTPDEFQNEQAAMKAIAERDTRDMTRTAAPLPDVKTAKEKGLIIIDNSHMTLQQTVHCMLMFAANKTT